MGDNYMVNFYFSQYTPYAIKKIQENFRVSFNVLKNSAR